ncbi:hypothetical protein DXG01_007279 [Tephrocybe rancida]|nr:hypothetical protein DXG01_007279 [Tephrocybe rancida]
MDMRSPSWAATPYDVTPGPQQRSRNPFVESLDMEVYGAPEMDMQDRTGTPRKTGSETWAFVYEAEELEVGMAG